VTIAFLVPPATIAFVVGRWLHRRENASSVRFRRAMRPVTGGLLIAAGAIVGLTVDHTAVAGAITVAVVGLSLALDIAPLWYCLAAGVVGALFV